MTFRSLGFLAVTTTALLCQSGCTAIIARSRVAAAEDRLAAARRAGAEKRCPYEFTAARLYLEKARDEESRARYGAAAGFADESARLSEAAGREASVVGGATGEEE